MIDTAISFQNTSAFSLGSVLLVNENFKKLKLQIASTFIELPFSSNDCGLINLQIFSIDGKLVMSKQINNTDCSQIIIVKTNLNQSGVYVVKAEMNGVVYSEKLVISN